MKMILKNLNKMKKIILLKTVFFLFIVSVGSNANAQCRTAGNGTNGAVHCMYTDSMRNCLFVGGGFHNSGNDTMNHCSYWNDSIYSPMNMMGQNGCNDSVWCFVMFNGDLYVGGNFTMAGGIACNHIARWDGSSWSAVGEGFNLSVHVLGIYNNTLYAGGEFTYSGTTTINYLGKWNGSHWEQVSSGTNGSVEAMCVWNNNLYVGGDFTMAGGITVNHICNWDGIIFSSVGGGFTTGMGNQCSVQSLCVFSGNLYAGGMFEHAGIMDMHNMAMWNGSSWSSIGDIDGGMMGDNMVNAMCVYNGQLFAGGNFGTCGSVTTNNLGMWDGSHWTNIGSGTDGVINSLAVYHNELYLAGTFSNAAGTSVSNIAKYSALTGIEPIDVCTNYMTVYPNPARDFVHVTWVNAKPLNQVLRITDRTGKIMYHDDQVSNLSGFQQIEVPVYNLVNGTYLITITSTNEQHTVKVVVFK